MNQLLSHMSQLPVPQRFLLLASGALLIAAAAGCDLNGSGSPEESLPPAQQTLAAEWMQMTTKTAKMQKIVPPAAARVYGYAGVAFYEGVRRVFPDRYRSLSGQLKGLSSLPEPRDGTHDWATVASVTEARVLKGLPTGTSRAARQQIDSLRSRQIEQRRSAGVSDEVIDRSQAYGQRLADALMTWIQQDGAQDLGSFPPWDPPSGEENWKRTPPDYLPALLPRWPRVRTFVIDLGTHQPQSPPPYSEDTSSAFYQQLEEVYQTANQAGEEAVTTGRYWQDAPGQSATPSGHWLSIAQQAATENGLDLGETARVFALTGITSADAFQSVWESKYSFTYIRPVTAIRRLFDDPDWLSSIKTPPHPEYTSGHSVSSGAAAEILNHAFGGAVSFTDRTNAERGFEPRSYDSFQAAAEEAGRSRVITGIHYPVSNQRGLAQGRSVAQAVAEQVQLRR